MLSREVSDRATKSVVKFIPLEQLVVHPVYSLVCRIVASASAVFYYQVRYASRLRTL